MLSGAGGGVRAKARNILSGDVRLFRGFLERNTRAASSNGDAAPCNADATLSDADATASPLLKRRPPGATAAVCFLKTVASCCIRPAVVRALQRTPMSPAPPMETAYAITARPRKGRVSRGREINIDAQDGQDEGTRHSCGGSRSSAQPRSSSPPDHAGASVLHAVLDVRFTSEHGSILTF